MTNLKQIDTEKNFKLLISTIVKMYDVGIRSARFKNVISQESDISIELSGSSIVVHLTINHEYNSNINYKLTGNIANDCNEIIDYLIKSHFVGKSLYDRLLSSVQLNSSYEWYHKYLMALVEDKKTYISTTPNLTLEEIKENEKMYDAVLDFIKTLGEYPEESIKIQTSSLYGKNGEVDTTKLMSESNAVSIVGTENDFTKVNIELDGDLVTLTQDVNGFKTVEMVMDDVQFEEVIEAYYKVKNIRDGRE